jgi:hypothetical protein
MHIASATHSPSNCYSLACPSKEFQSCLAIRVSEPLRSTTHLRYVRDKNNLRWIWRGRGIGPTRPVPRRGTRGVHRRRRFGNSSNFNRKEWCPGWESNPHEEKSPEDFKSSASAIPPPGRLADINVTEAAGWGKAACHEIETRKAASLRSEHGTVGSLFRESCASTD